jgi:hypothetical protein
VDYEKRDTDDNIYGRGVGAAGVDVLVSDTGKKLPDFYGFNGNGIRVLLWFVGK